MKTDKNRGNRQGIPIAVQVEVYFHEKWICHWCHRPLIFAPALKLIQCFVEEERCPYPTAFYDLHWRRDRAPLLDHMGAVIDHKSPNSETHNNNKENLVAACNKCNQRKSARKVEDFQNEYKEKAVHGLYGEPEHWDGLVSLFLILGRRYESQLSTQDRKWLVEIQRYLSGSAEKTKQ